MLIHNLLLLLMTLNHFILPPCQYFSVNKSKTEQAGNCEGECNSNTHQERDHILNVIRLGHVASA